MTMVEKQIYDCWAFQENSSEKGRMNSVVFKELNEKYKIAYGLTTWNQDKKCREVINQDDYDVIVEHTRTGYAHSAYRVIKNTPKLSSLELALICDTGNLCFGYSIRGNEICIHTD
jgi:hypothetical protein